MADTYFSDEEMNRERNEREMRAKVMHDAMLQGKRSPDSIRKHLRDTQKQQSEGTA